MGTVTQAVSGQIYGNVVGAQRYIDRIILTVALPAQIDIVDIVDVAFIIQFQRVCTTAGLDPDSLDGAQTICSEPARFPVRAACLRSDDEAEIRHAVTASGHPGDPDRGIPGIVTVHNRIAAI